MQYSKQCIDLVKKYEGYHRELPNGDCAAYPDVGSRDGEPVTIGYGTTKYNSAGRVKYQRKKVMLGDTLTKEQALDELLAELDQVAAETFDINSSLTQNQFDAAVSFFYNCGFPPSQVQRLKAKDLEGFRAKMVEYTKGGDGKLLLGLVNRRNEEAELWSKGIVVNEVTWWAFHRNADGSNSLVGYARSEPIERHDTNLVDALIAEFKSHKAKTFVVSDKPAPTLVSDEKPKKQPNPLAVHYFSQRDYGGSQAWSICGCTSVAMVLKFWGLNVTPDTVLKDHGKASCQSPPGCEGVFEKNGLKANSTYNGTWKQIRDEIDKGRPLVVHGRFSSSGHIIVIIGYDDKGYFCNDPAGKWDQVNNDSYLDNPKNGASVYYREEAMWKACGGDGDVWFSVAWI